MIKKLIEPKQQIPEERKQFSDRELIGLSIPVIAEQFLALLVGMADTLMISYTGEAAVSGVSLVNQINNVFILIFTALASGGAVIASQYIGSGEKEKGIRTASQLLMIMTVIAVGMTAIALAFGSAIFHGLFGEVEQQVFESGIIYLRITAFSFPVLALYNGCAGLYRSMGKTKEALYVSAAMNVINVAGNAIGVFGFRAGVAGVAYASLISRVFAAVVMMYMIYKPDQLLYVRTRDIFCFDASVIRKIFRVAIPNSIDNGLFQISKVALSSIVAMFGTVQIAANGVAQSFWSMSALFCLAMGPVFITVIGRYVGGDDLEGAEYYMKKLLRITYLGGAVWGIFFFLLTPLLLKLYDLSGEGVQLVILLVLIHNVFNILLCPVSFSMVSGLRAAGDVTYTMYAAIFSTVVCRVALSVLFCITLNMGVMGIAWAMAGDWAVKAALIWRRYKSKKWTRCKLI